MLWVLVLVTTSMLPLQQYEVTGPFPTAEICEAARQEAHLIGQPNPHNRFEVDHSVWPVCLRQDEVDAYVVNRIRQAQECDEYCGDYPR